LSLGDVVYEDTNFNGLRDNGEPGIKDVTVELWDPGADNAIGGSGAEQRPAAAQHRHRRTRPVSLRQSPARQLLPARAHARGR
jgi:hypothetical protein